MMTMDVRRRCAESGAPFPSHPPISTEPQEAAPAKCTPALLTHLPSTNAGPKTPVKRSFDVAFLMAPDEGPKKHRTSPHLIQHQEQIRLVTTNTLLERFSPPRGHEEGEERGRLLLYPADPLGLLIPSKEYLEGGAPIDHHQQSPFRSAFTKVTAAPSTGTGRVDLPPLLPPTSPSSASSGGALSPDLTYQDSMSPPASRGRSPVDYFTNAKHNHFFGKVPNGSPANPPPPYLYPTPPLQVREKDGPPTSFPHEKLAAGGKQGRGGVYPGDVLPYGGLAMAAAAAAYPFPGAQLLSAAANVTAALLPPSLAALTLPAQNVCAKCNVSFRMTSDLVYHMRSQHKNDSTAQEGGRRRREQDKLRCPVCNESFRERHHLTRHMTAHQDKDGDRVEEDDEGNLGLRRRASK